MGASVTIVMAADDAKVLAAHNRLFAAQQKAIENYEKAVAKSKQAQAANEADLAARKAAVQMEKARQAEIAKGQKLSDAQRTAQQRYNDELAEAKRLYDVGAISAGDLATRMNVLKKELADASGETARAKEAQATLTAAQAKAAQVIKEIATPLDRYNAKLKELAELEKAGALSTEQLAQAQRKAKQDFDEANKALKNKNSLLASAGDGIKTYVAGIGTAATAAEGLRSIWEQIKKNQEAGAAALENTRSANMPLSQIANSPEDYRRMQLQADALSLKTGADRNVVRDTLFSARSENFMDALPGLIEARQVISPETSKIVAGKAPAIFNGQIGSLESVSMILAAAKESNLEFGQMATALPSASEGGAIAKASPEETAAVLSVIAAKFGSAQTAADRIKAFATVAGIDQGGMNAEQRKAAEDKVEAAKKEFRRKEETVADLQEKLSSKDTKKEAKPALEKRLTRAQRDVEEFDKTRLEMPEQRETFKGMGIVAVAKKLQGMSEADRSKFLGTSQELNVAYNVITSEMEAIEKRRDFLKEERAEFAKGGGMLRRQVAIVQANPEDRALMEKDIAARRLEITQTLKEGIQGTRAKGAREETEANLLAKDDLLTQTVGSGINLPIIGKLPGTNELGSNLAAQMGYSQQTSAGFATGITRGFTRGITGQYGPSMQQAEAARFPVELDASKLDAAADKMAEAAKMNLEAAKLNSSRQPIPQSIAPAARANAATANQ